MHRSLAVALLLVLAGCSGLPGVNTPTDRTPAVPPGATAENTVVYANLSAPEQRAFAAAVEGGARFLENNQYIEETYFEFELGEPFREHEFVRRNGTYYRLEGSLGQLYASYRIATEAAQAPPNTTVRNLSSLDLTVREPVRWAIENGSYRTELGRWDSIPESLRSDYVRAGNRTYRLAVGVGDAWVEIWDARPVE